MKLVNDTDPILRQPTVNFDFNSGIDPEQLSKDMAEVLFNNGGLGLAAPQVGLNYRMFLMGDPESAVACFNPRIIEVSEETGMDIKLAEILTMDLLLKEDIQEKIIKMQQNSLRNTMILQEKLFQMVIRICQKTTYNILNIFLEF